MRRTKIFRRKAKIWVLMCVDFRPISISISSLIDHGKMEKSHHRLSYKLSFNRQENDKDFTTGHDVRELLTPGGEEEGEGDSSNIYQIII